MRVVVAWVVVTVAGVALLAAAGVLVLRGDDPVRVVERSYGTGAERVWVFEPDGTDLRSVVLFVHGLGPSERSSTPNPYRPWLRHLALQGNAVVYPRYETAPAERGAMRHLIAGARRGWREVGASDLPIVAIGYSRGGRLVADYAALAPADAPRPRAILSVFPAGSMDELHDLGRLSDTRVVVLAGDRDEVVGTTGASELVTQLAASGVPYENVRFEPVRSRGAFVASHLSVLETTPAAREAFWARADRLIDDAR